MSNTEVATWSFKEALNAFCKSAGVDANSHCNNLQRFLSKQVSLTISSGPPLGGTFGQNVRGLFEGAPSAKGPRAQKL